MASHDKPKTRSNENLNLKNPIQDPNHKTQTTINEQKWKKMKKNMKNKPGKKYSLIDIGIDLYFSSDQTGW